MFFTVQNIPDKKQKIMNYAFRSFFETHIIFAFLLYFFNNIEFSTKKVEFYEKMCYYHTIYNK